MQAELERARDGLRQAAIEREARAALDASNVVRLERLGALTRCDARRLRARVVDLAADLDALGELQAWTEARLAESRRGSRDREADARRSFGQDRCAGAGRSAG